MEDGLLQAANKILPDIQQTDLSIEDMLIKAWEQFYWEGAPHKIYRWSPSNIYLGQIHKKYSKKAWLVKRFDSQSKRTHTKHDYLPALLRKQRSGRKRRLLWSKECGFRLHSSLNYGDALQGRHGDLHGELDLSSFFLSSPDRCKSLCSNAWPSLLENLCRLSFCSHAFAFSPASPVFSYFAHFQINCSNQLWLPVSCHFHL